MSWCWYYWAFLDVRVELVLHKYGITSKYGIVLHVVLRNEHSPR